MQMSTQMLHCMHICMVGIALDLALCSVVKACIVPCIGHHGMHGGLSESNSLPLGLLPEEPPASPIRPTTALLPPQIHRRAGDACMELAGKENRKPPSRS